MALSNRLRFEILKRDGFRCAYCGRTSDEVKLEIDHIKPRCQGGTDEPGNLITACHHCNNGKGGIPLEKKSASLEKVANATTPGLAGKCFVIFDDRGNPVRQGVIRTKISEQVYLIQYFEWFTGSPNTMALVTLESMLCLPDQEYSEGKYMFFEDDEHMRSWIESKS